MAEEKLAPMREQNYAETRAAEQFDRFHRWARWIKRPILVYEPVRIAVILFTRIFNRLEVIDRHNVPKSGAVIMAPNHASFLDHFLAGQGTWRHVRFMAKSQMFKGPAGWFFTFGGVFPVRRGGNDQEAFKTARTILRNEGVVLIYPEGGRSRSGKIAETARSGVGRLARETRAPVVPVAIWGSHRCRNWKRLEFPKIVVKIGEPINFMISDQTEKEIAAEVLDEIKRLYAEVEELQASKRYGIKRLAFFRASRG